MAAATPIDVKNLDGYDAPPIEWSRIPRRLEGDVTQAPGTGGPNRHTCWLATIRPDGRPHLVAVGAQWVDGAFYFTAGPRSQRAANIAHDPHCVVSLALDEFDLSFEGVVERVTDLTELQRVADVYADGGWPASVDRDALALTADFSAPSAGPAPWNLYRIETTTVFALATAEPGGATRFRF
jgi:hypothetical protein